jgi:hypothetical protein
MTVVAFLPLELLLMPTTPVGGTCTAPGLPLVQVLSSRLCAPSPSRHLEVKKLPWPGHGALTSWG